MGPEVALALMAGGTAAQMYGQHQADKERRSIINRQLDQTDATQKHVTDQVLNEGKKLTPEARMQDMQADENRVYEQSQRDLGAASPIPEAASGAVSSDYQRSKALSAGMEGDRMSAIARELAKTRAPGELMTQEGLRRADLTGDIAHQWSSNRNMGQAAQLDANNVDMPWYGQLGQIAQMAGMAGGMMPAGAAAGAGSAATTGALGASAADPAFFNAATGAFDQAGIASSGAMGAGAMPLGRRSWWMGRS